MKARTKILIGVGVAVLVAAAVLCTVFLVKTKDVEKENKSVNFVGTWRVFTNGVSEDNRQYFVFDDKNAYLYAGGGTEALKSSEYSVKAESNDTFELGLGELGAYKVSKITDDIVILANGYNVYHIVRVPEDSYKTVANYTVNDFSGIYDVSVHSETTKSKMQFVEYMIFENGKLTDYRDGVVYGAPFELSVENNVLKAGPLRFYICEASAQKIVLAEITTTDSGEIQHLIWELVGRE